MGSCASTPPDTSYTNITTDVKDEESSEIDSIQPKILLIGRKEKLYETMQYKLSPLKNGPNTDPIQLFCGYFTYYKDMFGDFCYMGNNGRSTSDDLYFVETPQTKYFHQNDIKINRICVSRIAIIVHWITDEGNVYFSGRNMYHEQDGLQLQPILVKELENVIDIQSSQLFSIALCRGNDKQIRQILTYWTQIQCKYFKYYPSDIMGLIAIFYGINNKIYSIGNCCHGANGQGIISSFKYIKIWTRIHKFDDKNIVKIAVGSHYSIFLEDTGNVWCCGWNQKYLRNSSINPNNSGQSQTWEIIKKDRQKENNVSLPIPIGWFNVNKVKVMDVTTGSWHNLAIDDCNNVYSWGHNGWSQCGNRGRWGYIDRWYHPSIIPYFNGMCVDKIGCGTLHSYCRTIEGKHYLFGRNEDNECITYDNRNVIDIPHCINDIIKDKANGMIIKDVLLGYHNTKIIVSLSSE